MKSKTKEEIANEFHPTMELRWKGYINLLTREDSETLEQKFTNQKGDFEWREIPTV